MLLGKDGEMTGEEVGVELGGGLPPTGKTATSYTLSLDPAPQNWLGFPEQATSQVTGPGDLGGVVLPHLQVLPFMTPK